MESLLSSFQEQSIAWLAISAVVGGSLAALINLLFQDILSPHIRLRRESRAALRRFQYPLLRAADSLDMRIQNMIRFVNRGWYDDETDEYYRLSTLYVFGRYFAWCTLLERAAFLEYERSNKKARIFSKYFYRVYKALTGYVYFTKANDDRLKFTTSDSVPRMAVTAMGELLIRRDASDDRDALLSFVEFVRQIEGDPEFKRWYGYLDRMLADLRRSRNDPRWNRLLIVGANLRAFVGYLDPMGRQTSPRIIYHMDLMNRAVARVVREELVDSGARRMVQETDGGDA